MKLKRCIRCGIRRPAQDFWPNARRCTPCIHQTLRLRRRFTELNLHVRRQDRPT